MKHSMLGANKYFKNKMKGALTNKMEIAHMESKWIHNGARVDA